MPSRHESKTPENPKENNLAGRTVLLVNTGSSKKRFILQKLKKMGLKVVVLNSEKNWAQPYVDHWILAENANHTEAMQAVRRFVNSHPSVKIEAVLTFWEDDVLLTSRLVDRFNFIGIPLEIAKKTRNKWAFREFCEAQGLPTPRHRIVRTPEDLKEVKKTFEFPVVIKPAYGAESAFVMKVDRKEDLAGAFNYIEENISIDVQSSLSDGLDIFVEEFIDGDEVDIDILLQNGKVKFHSISDNFNKNKGVFFLDSGQSIPSSLPEEAQKQLLDMAEETLEKLGIQNGCIHFEAKYSRKGPFPIECNLRMGGDYIYSYTKGAWGIDLIEYAVKIALGEFIRIEKPPTPKKYIIGWDLHPEESGLLVELTVPEDLKRQNKSVEEVEIYKEIGDPVLVPPEGFENLGWVTVSGENPLDAQDNLDAALQKVIFKVAKFDPESSMGKTERKDRFSSAVLNKDRLLRMAKLELLKKTHLENLKQLPLGLIASLDSAPSGPGRNSWGDEVTEIERVLKKRGYRLTLLNANDPPSLTRQLMEEDIDLVFNLGGKRDYPSKNNPHLASLLELLQTPFIGSGPSTLFLASNKIRFKKILAYHDVPTPPWDYFYSTKDELNEKMSFPLIVKPGMAAHMTGISQESVVTTPHELRQQLKRIIEGMNMPALVEEYLEGDEYEAYILGNDEGNLQVLPLTRSVFEALPEDIWHLRSREIPSISPTIQQELPPKNISKKLLALISEMALDTYSIFGCRDYGKIKVKTDEDGNPYVIELNPSPSLHRQLGFAKAAELAGIPYPNLIEEIVYLAVNRYKKAGNLPLL